MAFQTSQGEQTNLSEINIIPLVDVMLIMLVIFMVSAPSLLKHERESLGIQVPEVSFVPKEEIKADDIEVVISTDGKIYLNAKNEDSQLAYDLNTLKPKLAQIYQGVPPQERRIYIKADKNALYQPVAQIISLSREMGILNVGMVAEKKGS